MGKIIACVNEKGGVAKTTTVKNVSIGLALKGLKVLVVDLDPSANLTTSLGLVANNEDGSICEILRMTMEFEDVPQGYGIVHQTEGIDVISSSETLHQVETELSQALQREIVLRRYLMTISNDYDFIFLDCPAGLGLFVTNALFCCDSIIIPVQPHKLAVEAMQNLFKEVGKIRKLNGTGYKPAVLGAVFTMVRQSTLNDTSIMSMLRNEYSKAVPFFTTYIPMASKIPESDVACKSVFSHAGKSTAALIYKDLVEEIYSAEMNESN